MRNNACDKNAKSIIEEHRSFVPSCPEEGNGNVALVKYDRTHHCLYAVTAYNCGKNNAIYPWRWQVNDTPFGKEVNNGWVMHLDLKKMDEEDLEDAFYVLTGNECWIGVDTSDFKKEMDGSEESNYSFDYSDVKEMFGFYGEYWEK